MKTDSKILQDVVAELKWEPSICADNIGVTVNDGVVTLSGHVESYSEKCGAEHAAQRIAGVQALAVEIEVQLPGSNQRLDADIARAAANVLAWMSVVPRDAIKVMVEGGVLTLSGVVDWEFQRRAVLNAVKDLMGMRSVSDEMVVKPKVTSSVIKADIEATLSRRALSDAHRIAVDVSGDNVTLSGSVSSWSERELVKSSVWGTPGVRGVFDNMRMI